MTEVTHFMRRPHLAAYSIERLYDDIRHNLSCDITVNVRVNKHFSSGLLYRVFDMIQARHHQNDVNHVTGDVHYLTYFLDKNKTILTIHDCEMLARSKGLKRFFLWLFWFWIPEKRVSWIVVVSEETKKQLQKFINCDSKKIKVIHNPVSKLFQPSPKEFNKSRPRLLQIGTKLNKNIERLLKAVSGLSIVLVIVGKLTIQQKKLLREYKIQFENLTGLSDQALLNEYYRCDLLLFTSTYEGFGMPIVEAQSVGRPVVTSNISSMPEVAGEAACFVNPYDFESIRYGITKIINNDEYRENLINLGWQNSKRFEVRKIGEKYETLYKSICIK